jgi:hypothetical protein
LWPGAGQAADLPPLRLAARLTRKSVPLPIGRTACPGSLCARKLDRSGTFRAHRVVICRETPRASEDVIAGHDPFVVYRRRLSGPGIETRPTGRLVDSSVKRRLTVAGPVGQLGHRGYAGLILASQWRSTLPTTAHRRAAFRQVNGHIPRWGRCPKHSTDQKFVAVVVPDRSRSLTLWPIGSEHRPDGLHFPRRIVSVALRIVISKSPIASINSARSSAKCRALRRERPRCIAASPRRRPGRSCSTLMAPRMSL